MCCTPFGDYPNHMQIGTNVRARRFNAGPLARSFFLDFLIYLQSVEIHSANGVLGSEGG
jgi:hypothetical protein